MNSYIHRKKKPDIHPNVKCWLLQFVSSWMIFILFSISILSLHTMSNQ